ncbi:hypothetical protein [Aquimarina sp. 433]
MGTALENQLKELSKSHVSISDVELVINALKNKIESGEYKNAIVNRYKRKYERQYLKKYNLYTRICEEYSMKCSSLQIECRRKLKKSKKSKHEQIIKSYNKQLDHYKQLIDIYKHHMKEYDKKLQGLNNFGEFFIIPKGSVRLERLKYKFTIQRLTYIILKKRLRKTLSKSEAKPNKGRSQQNYLNSALANNMTTIPSRSFSEKNSGYQKVGSFSKNKSSSFRIG